MTDKNDNKYVKYSYNYSSKTFMTDTIEVINKRVYDGDEVYDYRALGREHTVLAKNLEHPTISYYVWGVVGYGPLTFTEEDFLKACLHHFRQRDKQYAFECDEIRDRIVDLEKRLKHVSDARSDKMISGMLVKTVLKAKGTGRVRLSNDMTYLEAQMFEGEVVVWAYFDDVVSIFVEDGVLSPTDVEDICMVIDDEAVDSISLRKCSNDRSKFHKAVNLTRTVYKIETD